MVASAILTADFVQRMNEEHIHEILSCAVEPVRVRRRLLGVFQEETVDSFDDLLGFGQRHAPTLGQIAQLVPIVAQLLATLIHSFDSIVPEHVQLLGDGRDLLDAILMRGMVALERQVFARERAQVVQRAVLQVGGLQQVGLAGRPFFVYVAFVFELLGQVIESLETRDERFEREARERRSLPAEFVQQPVFESFLRELQAFPRLDDVLQSTSLIGAWTQSLLTAISLPSVGVNIGRLERRRRVCNVLKSVSSLAFCDSLGGFCERQ